MSKINFNLGADESTKPTTTVKLVKTDSIPVPAPPLPTLSAPAAKSESSKKSVPVTSEPKLSVPVQLSAPVALPSNITELERAVEIAAREAIQEYGKAISVLKTYTDEIKKIVDESVEKLDTTAWSRLKNKTSARDTAVLASEKAALVARATIGIA